MKPIMEAITAVEADTPRLSQLLPLWEQLLQHVEAWDESHETPECLRAGVVGAFKRRFDKHMHDSWYAAQGLDAAFAVRDAEGEWRLRLHSMDQDKRDRVVWLVARLVGTSESEVEKEPDGHGLVRPSRINDQGSTTPYKSCRRHGADAARQAAQGMVEVG